MNISFFTHNLVFLFSLIFTFSYSQETTFEKIESEIQNLCDTIVDSESDSSKFIANINLIKKLETISRKKKFHKYEFKNYNPLTILNSDDKKLKIFNWFIPKNNGRYDYYAYIKKCNKRGKKCNYFLLESIKKNEIINDKISYDNWYGCYFYELITIFVDKKEYYTLLGWDGNGSSTTKKIIEVLHFDNNYPFFGAKIFNNNLHKIVLEYSNKYSISLNYDEKLDCIVYDHLKPIDGLSYNNFEIYAPNLSYDVLNRTKSGWQIETNIYLNNNK